MEPSVWWWCTDDAEAQRLLSSVQQLYGLPSPQPRSRSTMPSAHHPAVASTAKQLATALRADPDPQNKAVADQFVRVGDEARNMRQIHAKLNTLVEQTRGTPTLTALAETLPTNMVVLQSDVDNLSSLLQSHLAGSAAERADIMEAIAALRGNVDAIERENKTAHQLLMQRLDKIHAELIAHDRNIQSSVVTFKFKVLPTEVTLTGSGHLDAETMIGQVHLTDGRTCNIAGNVVDIAGTTYDIVRFTADKDTYFITLKLTAANETFCDMCH